MEKMAKSLKKKTQFKRGVTRVIVFSIHRINKRPIRPL